MRKCQYFLFVMKRSYICYYIICMTLPLMFHIKGSKIRLYRKIQVQKQKKTKKLYDSFLWVGFDCRKATEPLRGDSLLFTTKLSWARASFLTKLQASAWSFIKKGTLNTEVFLLILRNFREQLFLINTSGFCSFTIAMKTFSINLFAWKFRTSMFWGSGFSVYHKPWWPQGDLDRKPLT